MDSGNAGDAAAYWLPGEKKNIPVQDQKCISNKLFLSGKLWPDLKLWYEPPVFSFTVVFMCFLVQIIGIYFMHLCSGRVGFELVCGQTCQIFS